MNKKTTLSSAFILLLQSAVVTGFCQVNNNGQLDATEEFTTKYTVPFTMPDGIKLYTDVYLPIVRDCLMVAVDETIQDTLLMQPISIPVKTSLEIIKKHTQIIIYDSIKTNNGWIANPNPYQLPLIFTRTPYGKGSGYEPCTGVYTDVGEGDATGALLSLLGYNFALQDMRGRYTSEGVYIPMYSDSWKKSAYHPEYAHPGDITSLSDPKNSNNHEDGYWAVKFIADSLTTDVLGKYNKKPPFSGFACNGSIGMFGASALGNTQLQAAAAHRIDPNVRGLKALFPIVASDEHYRFTGYQNGVFRERIITGWLKGQIMDLTDPESCLEDKNITVNDNDPQNTIHTAADYNLPNKFVVADLVTDYWTSYTHRGFGASYPNSVGRPEMDASRAFVNGNGDGDSLGAYSRYENLQVPIFHLSGWWDIFVDGQLETFHYTRKAMDALFQRTGDSSYLEFKKKQKIVIGPWAHQTIGTAKTGDMTYHDNVFDITKVDPDQIDMNNLPINEVLKSEFITYFRYTLNQNSYQYVGEPKFMIPESNDWQYLGKESVTQDSFFIRIPSKDYKVPYVDFFNFLNGTGDLKAFPTQVWWKKFNLKFDYDFDIPATGFIAVPGMDTSKIEKIQVPDFANDIAPVRFYLIGPNWDGVADNDNVGNFWFSSDTFPLKQNVSWQNMYFHPNNVFSSSPQTNSSDDYAIYVHDPDDPIKTIGGANMIVTLPDGGQNLMGNSNSQGQMDLTRFAKYTMDRTGVIKFETDALQQPLTVIGFPIADLWAKTSPAGTISGPTDTDFFVRILDVYPDGREFFVVEGCVNARARNYARELADNPSADFNFVSGNGTSKSYYPADSIRLSNIQSGALYEYRFKMMPLAYVWGKNHKMKILISSSNNTRYQSNPNLPIENGEFFRRIPLDGQPYNYNGQTMYARKAVQRIAMSAGHQSRIELPVYTGNILSTQEVKADAMQVTGSVYPNPASKSVNVKMSKMADYEMTVTDIIGKKVYEGKFKQSTVIDVKKLHKGVYFLNVTDKQSRQVMRSKFVVA